MNDAMKTESLNVNRESLTGGAPARDLGPGEVEEMFGPAKTPRQRLEAQGVEFVESEAERGGGGDTSEIHVPPHIKTMAATPENFPDADPKLLEKLRRKYPDGIPAIAGGQGGDSQEMLMNLLNAFQSEKPFEVSLTSARMRGVEASLALRYGWASEASKLIQDRTMIFPGYVNGEGKSIPVTMTALATLHQIVTTAPTAVKYNGDLIDEIVEEVDGKSVKKLVVAKHNFDSPPQLVREFKVNDPDHGDQFILVPLVPAKLEPFVQTIQRRELGAPRIYTPNAIEASRRQV